MDVVDNMAQFLNGNVYQLFAFAVKMFVDLDGRFLHDPMSFPRTTSEQKVGAAGNPFLTVFGVEGQTE